MQRLVYNALKLIVRFSLRLFYRRFTVQGKEHRDLEAPFIVVSNHPNTLMDALIVASQLRQRIGFVGNASLFRNPKVAAVLRFFSIIPIYRKQDLLPGETMSRNDDSFQQAYDFLGKGGAFLVFPEGTSIAERKLREIRTGTARIGLGYEDQMAFKGNLKILPVSINYSSSTQFRTQVHANLNPPIRVADYAQMHQEDPRAAVRALTDEISDSLSGGLVILDDPDQERMFQQAVRLLRKEWNAEKLTARVRFKREKDMAEAMRKLKHDAPESYLDLQRDLEAWFGLLDRLGLKPSVVSGRALRMSPAVLATETAVRILINAPFALVGTLAGYLPYRLAGWLPGKIAKDIEYRAPLMMMLGLIFFPITFCLISLGFWMLTKDHISQWWSLALLAGLPVCGWMALEWGDSFTRMQALVRMMWMDGRDGNVGGRLKTRRQALLAKLQAAVESKL